MTRQLSCQKVLCVASQKPVTEVPLNCLLPTASRCRTTQQVGDVAVGIQQNQMIAVCSNYVHKCYHPDYAAMDICSTSSVQSTLAQLAYSYNEFKTVHQGLYLVRAVKSVRAIEHRRRDFTPHSIMGSRAVMDFSCASWHFISHFLQLVRAGVVCADISDTRGFSARPVTCAMFVSYQQCEMA